VLPLTELFPAAAGAVGALRWTVLVVAVVLTVVTGLDYVLRAARLRSAAAAALPDTR
jgi:CDP-diacylglycerol--glycerol-3-phosphate 3-phosphatidyltransferase